MISCTEITQLQKQRQRKRIPHVTPVYVAELTLTSYYFKCRVGAAVVWFLKSPKRSDDRSCVKARLKYKPLKEETAYPPSYEWKKRFHEKIDSALLSSTHFWCYGLLCVVALDRQTVDGSCWVTRIASLSHFTDLMTLHSWLTSLLMILLN